MYINKKIVLIVYTLFLIEPAHADLYTESGNDGLGNSFSIIFSWNSVTTMIDSVNSVSFTDRVGSFNMATPYISINAHSYGGNETPWTAYDITDWYPFQKDISIGLTMTTVPIPTLLANYGLTPYAITLDGNATGCCYTYYTNLSLISLSPTISSVPIPTSIVLFTSGLLVFATSRKRETQA